MRARRKTVGGAPSDVGLHHQHPLPGWSARGHKPLERAEPLLRAPMALGTEEGGNLQLDPLLQAACGKLRDQLTGRAAIE